MPLAVASRHAGPAMIQPEPHDPRASPPLPDEKTYVSRAGLKLHHALHTFGIDAADDGSSPDGHRVRGSVCADFGCNVGGFTDCLLRHGAAKVYALDTGYGTLAWKLRNDPRVVVMERTNALHAPPPTGVNVSLIVVDMGWTPQRLCLPAARRWLSTGPDGTVGRVITLIKPHYELGTGEKHLLKSGVLDAAESQRVTDRLLASMPELGFRVAACTRSPILGGASKGNSKGNVEYLALLEPI